MDKLKVIFEGKTTYDVLVGFVVPLLPYLISFFAGIFTENKRQALFKNTNTQKTVQKQSGKGNAQSNVNQRSAGDSKYTSNTASFHAIVNYHPQINMPSVNTPQDALSPPSSNNSETQELTARDTIINDLEKYRDKFNTPHNFKDNLTEYYRDILKIKDGNVAAQKYFRIFKDVVKNICYKKNYRQEESLDIVITNVRVSFKKIEYFIQKSKHVAELIPLLDSFERSIIELFAYI